MNFKERKTQFCRILRRLLWEHIVTTKVDNHNFETNNVVRLIHHVENLTIIFILFYLLKLEPLSLCSDERKRSATRPAIILCFKH